MDFFTSTKGFGGLAGLAQQMASQVEKRIDKVLEIEDVNGGNGAVAAPITVAPAATVAEEPHGEKAEDVADTDKRSLTTGKRDSMFFFLLWGFDAEIIVLLLK